MNMLETFEKQFEERRNMEKANLLNRTIAKTIDFLIVVALYEMMPKIGFVAGITYLLIADGLFEGRSIGKRITGLKVIIYDSADTTAACGFRESIFRNFPFAIGYILFGILKAVPLIGGIISFVVIAAIPLFEIIVMLGNEEGMRLGDEIANTRVVGENKERLNVS